MRLNVGEWRAKIDYHTHSHKNLIKKFYFKTNDNLHKLKT